MFLLVMHKHRSFWHISDIFNAIFKRQIGACLFLRSKIHLQDSADEGHKIFISGVTFFVIHLNAFLGVKVFILIPLEIKRDFRKCLD